MNHPATSDIVIAGGGIVIAGGGLAGGAAAALLEQGGRRPLLLERTAGEHDKICGEFLSTEAQAHLAALGLDVARLGGATIDRVRLIAGGREASARLPFVALGLTRRRLDEALLDHAAAAGAKIERGVAVRALLPGGVASDAGTLIRQTVLLASGKHDIRGAKRDAAGTIDGLIGFKQYFRVPAAVRAALGRHIEVVLFAGGYAGLQLVEGGIVNLCLLVDPDYFDAAGRSWDGVFAALQAEPGIARRLGDATALRARPLSIAGVPYGYVAGTDLGGTFRLGDQGAVIPSFSGDGMSIALHSARLAAQAVLGGGTAAAYQAQLRRDVGWQVARARWLQRGGQTALGRALLLTGLGLFPAALQALALATRVPGPALRRVGLAARYAPWGVQG